MDKPGWPLVAAITMVNGTIAFLHSHDDVEMRRVLYPSAPKLTAPYSGSYTSSLSLVYFVDARRWP